MSEFHSVLFVEPGPAVDTTAAAPDSVLTDLNLDQIIDTMIAGRDAYNLRPFFLGLPGGPDVIEYRQQVFRDLERPEVARGLSEFARRMSAMRDKFAGASKLHYELQRQRWLLDAVIVYCDAVERLTADLQETRPSSLGLTGLLGYAAAYLGSAEFAELKRDALSVRDALASIRYALNIRGNRIRVRRYEQEADYSADVTATFNKFRQGAVRGYLSDFDSPSGMNHVEAGVLGFVARLHPDEFGALEAFCRRHCEYADPVLVRFDREIQFYVAYLAYIANLRQRGLPFCYPVVSGSREIRVEEAFDLALAGKLVPAGMPVVTNDFSLTGPERVIVISGPNQGGKTTLARTFGQLHYLGRLGCPVPGRAASLYRYDRLLTHFEQQERIENLRGKLHDDLVRIHEILSNATADSVVIMNEIFTSTTLGDALFLGNAIMNTLLDIGATCVFVTFLDELSTVGSQVVSMVSTVVAEDPARRTFKVIRKPADGLAYALAIAAKHGLTYEQLARRLAA